MIISHTDRESPLGKLKKSLCGKIMQQLPTQATLGFATVGLSTSYNRPSPPYSANGGPGQFYSGQLNSLISDVAQFSSTALSNISGGFWSGYGGGVDLGGTWTGSGFTGLAGGSSGTRENFSKWTLAATQFPLAYQQNGLTPPYIYTVGGALAMEETVYGAYANWLVGVVGVGSLRYQITQFKNVLGDNAVYPVKTIIPPTRGTQPLIWTDTSGNNWTVANGNGFIFIPIPEYNAGIVTIGQIADGGLVVLATSNGIAGLMNVLTILPAV